MTWREAHPRREVARLATGNATTAEREIALRHLLTGCRACRRLLAGRRAHRAGEVSAALRQAVDRAFSRFDEAAQAVEDELGAAEEFLFRLLGLTPEQRHLLVANSEAARSRSLVELLLDKAQSLRHTSARETLAWAELALAAAQRLEGPGAAELLGRSWAEVANARRIGADLPGATLAFEEADRAFVDGFHDPLVEADLLSLKASLAHHRRQLDEAVDLLERAIDLYEEVDQVSGAANCWMQIAAIRTKQGQVRAGIRFAKRALALAELTGDPGLRRSALHNLVAAVAEAGDAEAAARLARRARALFEGAPRLDRFRFAWLEARIDRDRGAHDRAAKRLVAVRAGFLAEGLAFEVALVSLDLASVYAVQGDQTPLQRLAAESLDIFLSLGVGRETLAALSLLGTLDRARTLSAIESAERAVRALPAHNRAMTVRR